ncbi:MAG: PPE family protein [Clostridia bacterium]|nr:PPE family protein [Clostridia bacterium]
MTKSTVFYSTTTRRSKMDKVTEKGVIIKGYKATDESMKCRGYQFVLGEWHEHDGELELCASGFHFCEYPSGPYCFYVEGRVFHVEAEFVLLGTGPGADLKHVAKRIRLVSEIETGNRNANKVSAGGYNAGNGNTGEYNSDGHNAGTRNAGNWNTGDGNSGGCNTGDRNTGNKNTGDRNTGNRNAGDWNTGDWNTGDGNTGGCNTGDRNTGDGNTGNKNTGDYNTGDGNAGDYNAGNWNTGDRNTGDGNTGDRNTGSWNTGNYNTGDGNAGDRNTGDGNVGDYHSGCLNHGEAKFLVFNEPANRDDVNFYLVSKLSQLMLGDDEIDAEIFLSLPNATPERIKALHDAHKAARAELKQNILKEK